MSNTFQSFLSSAWTGKQKDNSDNSSANTDAPQHIEGDKDGGKPSRRPLLAGRTQPRAFHLPPTRNPNSGPNRGRRPLRPKLGVPPTMKIPSSSQTATSSSSHSTLSSPGPVSRSATTNATATTRTGAPSSPTPNRATNAAPTESRDSRSLRRPPPTTGSPLSYEKPECNNVPDSMHSHGSSNHLRESTSAQQGERRKRPLSNPLSIPKLCIPATAHAVVPQAHDELKLSMLARRPSREDDTTMTNGVVDMQEIKDSFGRLTIDGVVYGMAPEDMECGDVIGSGTFGSVKSVFHKGARRLLAVKYLFDSIQPQERAQIMKELSLSSRFVSDYTIRYYGINMVEGQIQLYMELMRMSLDKMIARCAEVDTSVPEEILGKITCSLIRGLDYMWEAHRAMHRDIKPKNVLVGFDGSIKLCDFGLANIAVGSVLISNVGSELYLSPESLLTSGEDAPYDVRRDVWSLGTTLLEIANLEYPFKLPKPKGKKVALYDTMLVLRSGKVPPVREGYSASFQTLISSCLEVDVSLRPYFRVGSQPEKRLGSSSTSQPTSRHSSINSPSVITPTEASVFRTPSTPSSFKKKGAPVDARAKNSSSSSSSTTKLGGLLSVSLGTDEPSTPTTPTHASSSSPVAKASEMVEAISLADKNVHAPQSSAPLSQQQQAPTGEKANHCGPKDSDRAPNHRLAAPHLHTSKARSSTRSSPTPASPSTAEKAKRHPALMDHAFFTAHDAKPVDVTSWLDDLMRE